MDTRSKEIQNLTDLLSQSVGFFVAVTTFDGQKLNHLFFTDNFPQNDLLRSLSVVKKLVIEDLEKPFVASVKTDLKPEDIIDASTSENS